MTIENETLLTEIRDLLKLIAGEQQRLSTEVRELREEQKRLKEEVRLNNIVLNNFSIRNEILN